MARKPKIGGIVHTYQRYDPKEFPSPTQPPPDMVSPAFEHMLAYGSMRHLTEEEMARAVRLDPSQFQGLGPSIDMLIAMLLERKRKILERYETDAVQKIALSEFRAEVGRVTPPPRLAERYRKAIFQQQIYDLERIWYALGNDIDPFAQHVLRLMQGLSARFQIDELASKYEFSGNESMTIPQALEVKEELEKIDELLKQLEEARETAQIGVVDLDALAQYAEPGGLNSLREMQQTIENYVREMAEQQGVAHQQGAFQLTPQAYRIFQGRLLERIFNDLQSSRTGRHQGPIEGEGDVEIQQTKPYEFGDSLTHMDTTQSLVNAMIRQSHQGGTLQLKSEDIEVHRTRNHPKCATMVVMDMSGSMRYDGQYVNVKRMALALDGLIRREYPGDFLGFVEMYTFGKIRKPGEVIEAMVQLMYDMSDEETTESLIHPHFTNIQHSLQLARQQLSVQDTPNRQIVLITDGLPTAHFEEQMLYLLYPPHPLTEQATMREGMLCAREGITINIFLVPSWSQTEEDIRFAYRLAESTRGRVFFTAGNDLDRFVVWDYHANRRDIIQ
jgi:uncharacterized protein with von Willebrand factor type A (vWA) domain